MNFFLRGDGHIICQDTELFYSGSKSIIMKKLLLISLLLISFSTISEAFSGFTEGVIILKDGTELKGFVKFGGPQAVMATKVKFKKTKEDKGKKYQSTDIKYVVVTSMEYPMVFEYSYYHNKLGKKKNKHREWRRLVRSCDTVNVYVSNQFSFNNKGEMFYIYDQRISANKILFQRPGEEFPTVLGGTDENNSVELLQKKRQTKSLAEYFSDDSILSAVIMENKWNTSHFEEICNEYCENAE